MKTKPVHLKKRSRWLDHLQVSIVRRTDGLYEVHHLSQVGNPLKTRVDLRPDLGGPVLRMCIAPEDRLLCRRKRVVDPRVLSANYSKYCAKIRLRMEMIMEKKKVKCPNKPYCAPMRKGSDEGCSMQCAINKRLMYMESV